MTRTVKVLPLFGWVLIATALFMVLVPPVHWIDWVFAAADVAVAGTLFWRLGWRVV